MKYLVIFLFAVFGIFTLMILPFDDDYYLAYGMLAPLFPEELLEQSEIIFVGNITSKNILQVEYSDKVMTNNNGSLKIVMQNFTNNVNEYTVKIEEFLKAPQDFHTLTVREPTAGEKFEVGDRVILYIPKLDEPNKYRFESFSLPESCDSQDALRQQRLWFTGREFTIMQNDIKFDGYKKKEFQNLTANEPIRFAYVHDMQTMHGKSIDLEIEVFREDFDIFDYEQPVFNPTITAESKPCEWIASAEWEFIPTQDGVYRIIGYAKTAGDEPSSDEMLFGTPIHVESSTNVSDLPPLKQIKSGISTDEIKCKETLVLLQKYDGSPACVTELTKQKLIERGWTKDGSTLSKINTECMTIEQSKQIAPFFKTPSYLPEGYSYMCSRSGMPFESYIVYYNQEFPINWQIHELVSDGAIFIYQIDERNFVGEKEYATYGSPEQRTRETYDSVIEGNPSLNPQLITINGMLAYAVDSCPDCGMQTANFADGTFIQKSTSTETKIKFIDENGVSYMLKTTLPLSELIKVAKSLQ